MLPRRWLILGVLSAALVRPPELTAQSAPIREILRARIEQLRENRTLPILDTRVASSIVVPDFYERRGFRPAWRDSTAVGDLLRAIRDATDDGLDPRDYHLSQLERLRAEIAGTPKPSAELLADYDLLLSDALVRLGYHLRFGKVDPESLDPTWNLSGDLGSQQPAVMMQRAIDSGSLYAAIEEQKPKHPIYTGLKAALARYRALRAGKEWTPVPAGPTIKPGMADPRLPILRRRFADTGDLAQAGSDTSTVFDAADSAAVQAFQHRLGLSEDGLFGPATRAALNVPITARINQIKINLERGRWVLHDLDSAFVAVNVAAFRIYYIVGGKVVWQARTVVGQPYRKTPVFRATLKYLVFNPTWTVPPIIFAEDVLPELRKDPVKALKKRGLKVVDHDGREIDPLTIDWSSQTSAGFPYSLRQDAGDDNALGRVKFMLPNPYSVYLHDTPHKDLFERSQRAFSSGCIRVENALELAELILNDETRWNRAAIDSVISTGETRTISLSRQLPVLVLYWTAWVGADGRLNFRNDLYGRDARLLRALNGPFQFHRRPVFRSPKG